MAKTRYIDYVTDKEHTDREISDLYASKLDTNNPTPTGTLDLSDATITRGSRTKSSANMLFNDGTRVINFAGDDLEVMKPCGTLPSNTDLNDLGVQATGGIYYLASGNTYTNVPDNFVQGFLEVIKPTSSTQIGVQRLIGPGTTSTGGTYIYKWERYYISGWTNWQTIYSGGNLPTVRRGNLPTNTDLNDCIGADYVGLWNCNSNYTYTNMPSYFTWGTLEIYSGFSYAGSASVQIQRLTGSNGNTAWRTYNGTAWSDWRIYLTQDYSTTTNGITIRARRRGNTVSVYLTGTPTTALDTDGQYVEFGTLPAQYRPSYPYVNYILVGNYISAQFNIITDGTIRLGFARNIATQTNVKLSGATYARICYEVN